MLTGRSATLVRRARSALLGLLLTALGGWVVAGCAGYRLGPTGGQRAGESTMRVPFARNQTLEPRLAEPVTLALRRQIQQDGTYRLNTGGDAPGLILECTLVEYQRFPLAFRRQDIITVQEYELRLIARIVVTEASSGAKRLDRQVIGRTGLVVSSDQTSAERQAVPLLAEDLARKVVPMITEGPW